MNSITCSASTTAPSGASSDGEGCENASTNRGNTSTNGEQIGQNKQTGSSAAEEPEKSANKSTNNNKKLSITRFCDAFLYMSTAFFMADFIHMTKELIVRGKMPHQGLERVVHHLIQCTANIPTLLTGGPAGLVMRSYLTQGTSVFLYFCFEESTRTFYYFYNSQSFISDIYFSQPVSES